MKVVIKEPNNIRKKGLEALNKELGPLGMTCFIRQFDKGTGDYTKEREELNKEVTIEDIIKQTQNNGNM